jgi:amino acid permease
MASKFLPNRKPPLPLQKETRNSVTNNPLQFCSWDTETFISSYINIPIIFVLYFGYKFVRKTKIIPLQDIPIRHFLDIANQNPEPPVEPPTGWRRFNLLWS